MQESIVLVVATGLSAILGSLITGVITYKTVTDQRLLAKYKRRLIRAYCDVAAFHRLEERYASALAASDSRNSAAWKRDIRKQLRDAGHDSPSENATAQRSEQAISELE